MRNKNSNRRSTTLSKISNKVKPMDDSIGRNDHKKMSQFNQFRNTEDAILSHDDLVPSSTHLRLTNLSNRNENQSGDKNHIII